MVEKVETYTVKSGDNIWDLCYEDFDVPVWLMFKYNSSIDLNRLKLSQKIFIPVVTEVHLKPDPEI